MRRHLMFATSLNIVPRKEVRDLHSKSHSLLCFALNPPAFSLVGDDDEILISQISSCLHRETYAYANSSEWKVSGLVIQSKISSRSVLIGFDLLYNSMQFQTAFSSCID